MTTTLISKLDTMIDKLSNIDSKWVIFVHDHQSVIKSLSAVIPITDADRDRYRYKFEHFLRDNQCSQSIMWIVKDINDVYMYEDFTVKDSILIPSLTDIVNLYRKYRTSQNII